MSTWNYIEKQKERLSKERKRLEDLLSRTEEKYESLKQSALEKIQVRISLIDSQFQVLENVGEGVIDKGDDYEKVDEPGLFDIVNNDVRYDPGMTPKAGPFVDTKESFDDYWTKDEEEDEDDGEDGAKEQVSSQQDEVLEYTDNDDSAETEEETSDEVPDKPDDEDYDDEEEYVVGEEEEIERLIQEFMANYESESKKKGNAQDGNGEVRVFPIGVPVSTDEEEDEDSVNGHESFVRDMKMIRGMFNAGKRN